MSGCDMGMLAGQRCSADRRPSLFRGVKDRWKAFLYSMGQMSAGLISSPVSTWWCLVHGSVSVGFLSDELVPSHCRIPCLSGIALCRPVGLLGSSPQCLRLAFV